MAENEEMVTVGCRLPNGYTLEIGLQTTVIGGPLRRPIDQVQRLDNYQRIKLKGTHWHNAKLFRSGVRPPSVLNPEPFLNRVPKAFWDQWVKDHPKAAVLRNGDLFVVTQKDGEASVKAAIVDVMSRPASLNPMDPTKKLTVGNDVVETANFDQ